MHPWLAELGEPLALEASAWVLVLCLCRVLPLVVLVPWLSLRGMPLVIRASVAIALAVALSPLALASTEWTPNLTSVVPILVARELLVGLAFGLGVALPLWALQWTGELVDTFRGASFFAAFDPSRSPSSTPLGQLILMLGIVLFLAMGGHRLALSSFVHTLDVAPIGDLTHVVDIASVATGAIRLTASALAFAASLAAPAAVAVVFADVSMALVSRSSPQLPSYFVGLPLRGIVGIVAVLLSVGLMVDLLPQAFRNAVMATEGWILP